MIRTPRARRRALLAAAGTLPAAPGLRAQPAFLRRPVRMVAWCAIVAPAATLPAILESIDAAMQAAGRTQPVIVAVRAGGSEPRQLSTAELGAFIRREMALWARAVSTSGVQAE